MKRQTAPPRFRVSAPGSVFVTRPQHLLKLRKRQQLTLRLRLLRRWSAGHQEIAKVLRRRETRIVVRATLHDLPILRQVLTPGAQRVLYRAHRAIENGPHFLPFVAYELCDELPALRRVRVAGCKCPSDALSFGDVGHGGTGPLGSNDYLASTPSRNSSPVPATPSNVAGAGTNHEPPPLEPANRPVPPTT